MKVYLVVFGEQYAHTGIAGAFYSREGAKTRLSDIKEGRVGISEEQDYFPSHDSLYIKEVVIGENIVDYL